MASGMLISAVLEGRAGGLRAIFRGPPGAKMVQHERSSMSETPAPRGTETRQGADSGNGARVARVAGAAGAGAPMEPRGGGVWTVVRGDTLWRIARRTYGSGRYWRNIADANPDRVFRGGDLILVGAELALPVVDIPVPGGTTPTSSPLAGAPPTTPVVETPVPVGPTVDAADTSAVGGVSTSDGSGLSVGPEPPVDGGVCVAVEPRAECNEYGDFLIYPDAFEGELPAGENGVEVVRERQFATIVAEREARAVAQRDAAVSTINDNLSYGAFDWAITDGEANESLSLLGALPLSQLRIALGRVNTDRLLDNLPAASRRTAAFTKIIVALGPSAVKSHIQELLSYGVFDWAVTDGDVLEVVSILNQLAPSDQLQLLTNIGPKFVSRLATNLSHGLHVSPELYKRIFDFVPDTDAATLEALVEARFDLNMSSWWLRRWQMDVKENWTAPGLRRLWTLFEQLPPDHVENSETLDIFLRQKDSDGSGVYYGGLDAGVVSYHDVNAGGGFGSIMVSDGAGGQRDVALNSQTTVFNTVVRHEIGHAVDAAIKASEPGGYVRTAESAGKWETYGGADAFVDAILAAGGGIGGHGYANEAAYESAMRKAVDDKMDFKDALQKVDPALADPGAAVTGPVAAVYDKKRWMASEKPWYDNPNRPAVGQRQWHRPYDSGEYVSYLAAARPQHGVSGYQFRAPGEWFAEAYAAYYSDADHAGNQLPGTRLRTRDQATAAWFDANVDKGYSLAQRTGQASPGAGTTGTPPAPGGGAGGTAPGPGGSAGPGSASGSAINPAAARAP